jgi:hypothetical protein
MKYYFIAFSLLMSTSAIAIDDDQKTSSLSIKVGKQEANSSSDEEPVLYPISIQVINSIPVEAYSSSDEEPDEYYSSGEESDGEPVYLEPISFQRLNPISPVGFVGLTPEEQNKALIDAILKANPGLHLPVPKED